MAEAGPRISKRIVIRYVEEMEKAHQCFLFKEYLRQCDIITHNSIIDDISYELTWQNERKQGFPLVEENDIYDLVHQYIMELEDKDQKVWDDTQDKDIYAVKNRTVMYYVLVRARVEGYLFEVKPETELEKMKKSGAMFYHDLCVCRWKPPADVEARTVTVSNISLELPEKDARIYFRSFGPIKNFRLERTSECQIAHVTYKDLSDVKYIKKSCAGFRLPGICQRTKSGWAPMLVHQKNVQAGGAESVVKKVDDDVNIVYAEALSKYDALRTYYSQFQSKDVKASKYDARRIYYYQFESKDVKASKNAGMRRFKMQSRFKCRHMLKWRLTSKA